MILSSVYREIKSLAANDSWSACNRVFIQTDSLIIDRHAVEFGIKGDLRILNRLPETLYSIPPKRTKLKDMKQ